MRAEAFAIWRDKFYASCCVSIRSKCDLMRLAPGHGAVAFEFYDGLAIHPPVGRLVPAVNTRTKLYERRVVGDRASVG